MQSGTCGNCCSLFMVPHPALFAPAGVEPRACCLCPAHLGLGSLQLLKKLLELAVNG